MIVCKRVTYTGRVQGVGFRYTVSGLARGFGVAGTVRNCPDGSVELIVQGEETEVKAFMNAIARRMEGYVQDQMVQDIVACPMQGFHITR
ncbi:MAG TPA: acylphosphatase [Gemmataceae bacterium]|nr:acylphosphatase [Gemmataceae bacterium]